MPHPGPRWPRTRCLTPPVRCWPSTPTAVALPPEAVWLVYPEHRALRADTEPRVLVQSTLPLTWNGWRLVQLDLSGVSWLELEPAGAAGTRRHPVRSRLKPQLMTGAAIPGARTTDGLAVFGMLPAVRLPAGEARWRVEVRRSGRRPGLGSEERRERKERRS